jgi:hypothetical protein
MLWLTKSRFLSRLQCRLRLWFEIHQSIQEASASFIAALSGRFFDEVVRGWRLEL